MSRADKNRNKYPCENYDTCGTHTGHSSGKCETCRMLKCTECKKDFVYNFRSNHLKNILCGYCQKNKKKV